MELNENEVMFNYSIIDIKYKYDYMRVGNGY